MKRMRSGVIVVFVMLFGCGSSHEPDAAPGTMDASGRDAGWDAGFDAGVDAGLDGGVDAGFDGGVDAGFDGGFDAGRLRVMVWDRGYCFWRIPCASPSDCPFGRCSVNGYCKVSPCACALDEDCSTEAYCLPTNEGCGFCYARAPTCTTDADCDTFCVDGYCAVQPCP